jgi:hypothetical protein
VIASTTNPQTNAILKHMHKVIANQLWSLHLMSLELNSLADIQQEFLAPVQWAMNSTYHTTLQVTSAQLAFHHDMVMLTSYMVHWQSICQWHQAITDHDNLHENACRVPHTYSVRDLVLIHQDTHGKLSKPTCGPYHLIDVACQHVNGSCGWFESFPHNIQHSASDWFHLNLTKTIENTICHTMCLTTLFPFW